VSHVTKAPTAASWRVTDAETGDGTFIGLALSGGGSRAANFSAALLLELRKRELLQHVDVISAVSGGAIAGTYYATGGPFSELQARELLGSDFEWELFYRAFYPSNLFRLLFTNYTTGDIVYQILENKIFHGAKFGDIPSHPKLLINATRFGHRYRWTFTDEAFDSIGSDLSVFPIAAAVRASSTFPKTLANDIRTNYREPRGNYNIHLYDGGSIDNLGIQALFEYLIRAGTGKSLSEMFPKGCLIIMADAELFPIVKEPKDGSAEENFRDALETLYERERLWIMSGIGLDDQHIVSDALIAGATNCACKVVHLSLRHLNYSAKNIGKEDDLLANRVTRIETSGYISKAQQDDLYQAARSLAAEADEIGAFQLSPPTCSE
jgi:hypothetical protein